MSIYIIRLKPNTEKTVDMEVKKKATKDHHDFVEELVSKNIILFGGPIIDQAGGMLVANVPSEDILRETLSGDPFISEEYVHYEVSEWNIAHNPDNFKKLL